MPRLLLLLAALSAGCGTEPPAAAGPPPPAAPANATPAEFQPAACGKIVGAVTWTGTRPTVPPVIDIRPRADGGFDKRTLTHPYAPDIDPATYALRGAVVYLRNVPTARSRPWDLPPARVDIRGGQIVMSQGDKSGRVGFVRRGDPVSFQSSDAEFNVLRARGAAFFAIPFPEPGQPRERAFDTFGRGELTSAAGFAWQAADLFVCDHPYYTVSGADGRYAFEQVPAGTYELVVWHPNWVATAGERNPESGIVQRWVYGPPLEFARPVMVVPGRVTTANGNLGVAK